MFLHFHICYRLAPRMANRVGCTGPTDCQALPLSATDEDHPSVVCFGQLSYHLPFYQVKHLFRHSSFPTPLSFSLLSECRQNFYLLFVC